MISSRKFIVFIFVAILFSYMLYTTFYSAKKHELKKSIFLVLLGGLGLLTIATFIDCISAYTSGLIDIFMRLCFTLGSIIFILGIILWDRYMRRIISSLYKLSITDAMTGVYNRNGIEEAFERTVNVKETFYVLVFDLDKTKSINDEFGHLSGDKYIINAAKIISEEIGIRGFLGRFGGDEFIALLGHCNEEEVIQIVFSIKQRTSKIFSEKDTGISVGYSMYDKEGTTFKQLLKVADERMYKDKKARK